MEQGDAGVLELLDEFSLNRIGNCAFSDESEGGMAGFCTGLDHELSDVPCSSNDQNLAFLGHCNFLDDKLRRTEELGERVELSFAARNAGSANL